MAGLRRPSQLILSNFEQKAHRRRVRRSRDRSSSGSLTSDGSFYTITVFGHSDLQFSRFQTTLW